MENEDVKQEEASSASEEVQTEATPSEDFKARALEYKRELERQQKLADERLEAIKRLQKSKYEREEAEQDQEESNDPKSVIRAELDAWKREQAKDVIESELESLTDDPDERELTRLVYENELRQSGLSRTAIKNDLKKALAIANLPKLETHIRSRVKAEASKAEAEDTSMKKGSVSGGSGRQPLQKREVPTTEGERKFMDFVDRIKSRYTR